MNLRIRGAVAAFAVMAAFASTASAQGTAGKGSLGGVVGVPYFLSDEDTKDGQSPRILGQAQFQYAFNDRTRLATSFGFGWVGYKDGTPGPYPFAVPGTSDSTQLKDDLLTKFQPITVSILRSFKEQGKGWVPYVGAGVNLTRIEIVNQRRKIKDPVTFDSYVNWAPGVQAQLGTEYFLSSNSNVAFDWHARFSKLFSKDEEKFPSGFTGPHSYVSVNFAVNVYFWPIGHKPIETAKAPPAEAAPAAPDASAPAAPAAPETPPPPPPVPTPPSTPDSTGTPDTTRAPGAPSSLLHRGATKATATISVTPAPSAAAKAIARDEAPAVCPVRPDREPATSMFGIPGVASLPPRHDEPPVPVPAPASTPASTPSPAPHEPFHPEDGPTP